MFCRTVLLANYRVSRCFASINRLMDCEIRGAYSFCAMPMLKARFRISLKDHAARQSLKVELIEQPWPGRFWIRQNGRRPARVFPHQCRSVLISG